MAFTFTPVQSLLGGLTIGLLASSKLALTGRILGISGTLRGVVQGTPHGWRLSFLSGLVVGGGALTVVLPTAFDAIFPAAFTLQRALLAGWLVGLGTSRGSGCTSGHGICGNARLSPRSLAATLTFMASGAVAAALAHTAALFALPQGVAPLATEPASGIAFGAWLLIGSLAFKLLLAARAQQVQGDSSQRVAMAGNGSSSSSSSSSQLGSEGQVEALSNLAELATGFLFALALGVSGMLKPSKVAGFLSILSGSFDPSLVLVMGGALLVALPSFQTALRWRRLSKPLLADTFQLPTRSDIDFDLISGALLFGAGWGIGGMCPGPALVSLATLQPQSLAFVAAMALGMYADAALPKLPPSWTL